jgi:membrane protease YdiL (CAAX protease family)
MTLWIKRHQICSFFILAFAISWAIWIPVILFVSKDGEFHPLLYIGGYGPFLSAGLVAWIAEGGHGLRQWLKRTFRWRIHIVWYIAGWFLLPIIGLGLFRFSLYLLLGGRPDFSEALPWWNYLIAVPIGALFMGGNEEPGWRGYALPKLLEHLNPITASLILGVPWVIWHLPMYLLSGGGISTDRMVSDLCGWSVNYHDMALLQIEQERDSRDAVSPRHKSYLELFPNANRRPSRFD